MLLTLRENYPQSMAGCVCVNCPRLAAKFLALVRSTKNSTMQPNSKSKWQVFGKIKEEGDMRAVLRKMMPEGEVEKCVYLFSTVE